MTDLVCSRLFAPAFFRWACGLDLRCDDARALWLRLREHDPQLLDPPARRFLEVLHAHDEIY